MRVLSKKFNVAIHVAAYLRARRRGPGQSRQERVGVHRSVVLHGVPFRDTVFLQGALTCLSPRSALSRIPAGGEREREDQDTGKPYGAAAR